MYLTRSQAARVRAHKVNLPGGCLLGEDLSQFTLVGANLGGTWLSGLDLQSADLRGANLSGADLSEANLAGANLVGANLREARLDGADLRQASLQCSNMRWATLDGANLSGANLSEARLSGADLGGVNLSGANLTEARLPGCNLGGATLNGANLSGANLKMSNLTGATLGGANITGCNMDMLIFPEFERILGDLKRRHNIDASNALWRLWNQSAPKRPKRAVGRYLSKNAPRFIRGTLVHLAVEVATGALVCSERDIGESRAAAGMLKRLEALTDSSDWTGVALARLREAEQLRRRIIARRTNGSGGHYERR